MVQTLILTRAFAISALFVGACPVSFAAPIPRNVASSALALAPRLCHVMGCLFADPTPKSASSSSNDTDINTDNSFNSQTVLSSTALEVLDFLISSLTSARDTATSVVSNSLATVVEPEVAAVNVDDLVTPIAEEIASRVDAEASDPVVDRAVVEREIEESVNLDALV